MKRNLWLILTILLLVVSVALNVYNYTKPQEYITKPYVVEYNKLDTITQDKYIYKHTRDTLVDLKVDTLIKIQNDTLYLPIEDYCYTYTDTTENYTLLVKNYGKKVADFQPIDSLVYNLTIINKTIEKTYGKSARFCLGTFVGLTYYDGVKPCVGVGIGIPIKIRKNE